MVPGDKSNLDSTIFHFRTPIEYLSNIYVCISCIQYNLDN